jgi:8-oxo-dGTP pyrophosphatase MutT (NUDIX family)
MSMMDASLPDRLGNRLFNSPPGRTAQQRGSVEMSFGRHFGPTAHDARSAAVMALLYQRGNQWQLPLIVRPPQSVHHANQVSLPGGAAELGEAAEQAALRELEEELGVPSQSVHVIGALSPLFVFASNHDVRPFVGFSHEVPAFEPNALEVARLLEMPIDYLLAPGSLRVIERRERGVPIRTPAYCWDHEEIWGATCMILAELAAVVSECQ